LLPSGLAKISNALLLWSPRMTLAGSLGRLSTATSLEGEPPGEAVRTEQQREAIAEPAQQALSGTVRLSLVHRPPR
jgi:hypothetical protein